MDKKYYRTSELAKALGFSRQTILAWIKSGRIKAVKGVREYRISVEEYERILREGV